MLLHLVLDESGYWVCKLGLYKSQVNPQINWLYPFSGFRRNKVMTDNKEVLRFYLINAWPVALLELLLIFVAIIVYI